MRSVRKVETRDIHPGLQEAVDNFQGAAGGTDGADNLRVAEGHTAKSLSDGRIVSREKNGSCEAGVTVLVTAQAIVGLL
jgi:hypothetical protein